MHAQNILILLGRLYYYGRKARFLKSPFWDPAPQSRIAYDFSKLHAPSFWVKFIVNRRKYHIGHHGSRRTSDLRGGAANILLDRERSFGKQSENSIFLFQKSYPSEMDFCLAEGLPGTNIKWGMGLSTLQL